MAKNDGTRAFYLLGLRIMADFGATLAVPAVLGAWIGAKLDARWGTKPYALFGCLLLAFGLSALSLKRKAVAYGAAYQRLVDQHDHPADRR
jgi:F0F1-type ATP synthase assembly protein I